jgi:hypothetical protein
MSLRTIQNFVDNYGFYRLLQFLRDCNDDRSLRFCGVYLGCRSPSRISRIRGALFERKVRSFGESWKLRSEVLDWMEDSVQIKESELVWMKAVLKAIDDTKSAPDLGDQNLDQRIERTALLLRQNANNNHRLARKFACSPLVISALRQRMHDESKLLNKLNDELQQKPDNNDRQSDAAHDKQHVGFCRGSDAA